MKLEKNSYIRGKISVLSVTVSLLALVTGCKELNTAADGILGLRASVESLAPEASPSPLFPKRQRMAERRYRFLRRWGMPIGVVLCIIAGFAPLAIGIFLGVVGLTLIGAGIWLRCVLTSSV